jgi:S1-C subfamily serine protease
VTTIDWVILAVTLLLAVYGYGQGFLVGVLSLAGFAGGAFLGTRVAPLALPEGAASPYAPLFGLLGALVIGGILAIGFEGMALTLRTRFNPATAVLDGLLGAGLTACVALGICWIVGAFALQTPAARAYRGDIQRSEILRRLNAALPPSGPILNVIARIDPFPEVRGPRPRVDAPDSAIARDPDVRAAAPSVVRILGTACGLGVQGSGWVAAGGLVVTNAHVVAGQQDTIVQAGGDGPRLEAEAVHFDPRNDLAVLRVAGLDRRPLAMASEPRPGTSGAVLGFPSNGPYDVEPARLGDTVRALSEDAYGRGPLNRRITVLRADVRQGNSGGPMVDAGGRVVTTVFAATAGGERSGGYGVPNGVVRDALAESTDIVGTGPCAP